MVHLVELFVSEHCPSCSEARGLARGLAAARPDVKVVERDVREARAVAARYRLFATPAFVVDQEHVMYGVPTLAALVARIEGPGMPV